MGIRSERRAKQQFKSDELAGKVLQPALSTKVFVSCQKCPLHQIFKTSEGDLHENFRSRCLEKARDDIYYGKDMLNEKLSFYTLYVVVNEKCHDAINIILEGAE